MKLRNRNRATCFRDFALKMNTKRLEKTIMKRCISLLKLVDRIHKGK